MKTILTTALFLLLFFTVNGQETVGNRVVIYQMDINGLKTSEQEKNIEKTFLNQRSVRSCDVDPLNYSLTITVFEKEGKEHLSADQIKIILIENNVEIKTIKREIKK